MQKNYQEFYNKETLKVQIPLKNKQDELFYMSNKNEFEYVEHDFVELEGSEKQVAWADDIRYEIALKIQARVEWVLSFEDIEYKKEKLQSLLGTEEDDITFLVSYAEKLVPFLFTNYRKATTYIDNRDCTGHLFGKHTYGHPMAPKKRVFNTKTLYIKMKEKGL
jgi:hypothetical protein